MGESFMVTLSSASPEVVALAFKMAAKEIEHLRKTGKTGMVSLVVYCGVCRVDLAILVAQNKTSWS